MNKVTLSSNAEDISAIVATVLDYTFGVATKDWGRLQRAFDVPKAQMKLISGTADDEKVFVIPVQAVWEKIWSRLPDSETHAVEITAISVKHGRIAIVELDNNNRFFDQLSLYKINGQWKIYDKLTRMLDGGQIPEKELVAMFGEN